MSLKLNPPPLQLPPSLQSDKAVASFFGGLITTIYQMWNSLYGIRTSAKTKTTDATVTALLRAPVANGKTQMIQAMITARRTGGSAGANGDSAFYVLTGAYKNVGGVLTGIGTPNLIGGEDQPAWNVGFSAVGTDMLVTVTGAANNEIVWEGSISVYQVGA